MNCPKCGSVLVALLGTAESDIAVLGTDEYVCRCDDCRAEWVREKGGSRYEILAEGDFEVRQ